MLNFKGEVMKKHLRLVKDFADIMDAVNFEKIKAIADELEKVI